MNERVLIVPTGAANLASVRAALSRCGVAFREPGVASEIIDAEFGVLPGVGSFGHAMGELAARGWVEPLRRRIAAGLPTLGICLGMQVLGAASEESPGVDGLGVVAGRVRRLSGGVRVPQMGWNAVEPADGAGGLVAGGCAYFANSFAFDEPESLARGGWRVATTTHGGTFAAAIERGRVLACQFHPELSGAWGLDLIRRWLAGEPAGGARRLARAGLRPRVIPCLDVRDGRVVKGVKFQNLRDSGDPAERAGLYERDGADELVILDVSATPEGRATAAGTVAAVRRVLSVPLTVGGGVRSVDDAKRLLDAGADKVGVNSAAVERPGLITELAERFGRQCVVLALDAARRDGGWEVVTRSGTHRTGIDALRWAREGQERGAGEILLTSWDRDGTGEGYDLDLLSGVSGGVGVPVIASGGASEPGHLASALGAGADAVLAAGIFHDGRWSVAGVKAALSGMGVRVREAEAAA